jgi:Fe-S cluster assembly iron-binding protein IscA
LTGERRDADPASIRVTERALEALRSEGIEPSRSVLVIRYVLGCGGAGYRITFTDRLPGEGMVVETAGGLKICLDDHARSRLTGAAIDYDDKENEGFFLDHPDAAFAAFC